MLISSHENTGKTDASSNSFTSKSYCCHNPEASVALSRSHLGLSPTPSAQGLHLNTGAPFKLSLCSLSPFLSHVVGLPVSNPVFWLNLRLVLHQCLQLLLTGLSGQILDLVHHFVLSRGCGRTLFPAPVSACHAQVLQDHVLVSKDTDGSQLTLAQEQPVVTDNCEGKN